MTFSGLCATPRNAAALPLRKAGCHVTIVLWMWLEQPRGSRRREKTLSSAPATSLAAQKRFFSAWEQVGQKLDLDGTARFYRKGVEKLIHGGSASTWGLVLVDQENVRSGSTCRKVGRSGSININKQMTGLNASERDRFLSLPISEAGWVMLIDVSLPVGEWRNALPSPSQTEKGTFRNWRNWASKGSIKTEWPAWLTVVQASWCSTM